MVRTRGALLLPLLLAANPAYAAGGAHVVDDAAVVSPGTCHLEGWVTLTTGQDGLVSSGPACTRKAWPNLEIGGSVAHGWASGVHSSWISLSPKLLLLSEEHGVGIAIATSLGYRIDHPGFETAAVTVPLTIPANEWLRINVNAGWHWTRTNPDRPHAAFVGSQAEIALKPNLGLMIEGFTRSTGKAGVQTGLRWTTANGRIDLDLLAGRYVDGATPTTVTLGITLR